MKNKRPIINDDASKELLKVSANWEEISVNVDPGLTETVVMIIQNPVAHSTRQWEGSQGTVEVVIRPAVLD